MACESVSFASPHGYSYNAAIRQVALEYFRPVERECLHRYVEELHQRLGRQLLEVHLFGSIARGDAWPAASPMRSDIDLLAVCSEYPPQADIDDLVNATYPLFLAYGGLDFEGVWDGDYYTPKRFTQTTISTALQQGSSGYNPSSRFRAGGTASTLRRSDQGVHLRDAAISRA